MTKERSTPFREWLSREDTAPELFVENIPDPEGFVRDLRKNRESAKQRIG